MIKLFNPSKIVFSLLVAVAWERIYHKQMIKKLGIGLPSIFYYNDGTGFHLFRNMEDQKALDVFLRRRLASDPDWVRHAMQQQINEIDVVVTDYGGYLCHAAIAAREFKVPCVVGTKIATQVFKDGDEVEVDAEMGIVRKN